MEYILLDTNMIIYREGEKALDKNTLTLSRLLLDSAEFKLCVHPLSLRELENHKFSKEKETIISKTKVYHILDNPPIATKEFLSRCGGGNNKHEYIDNALLYSVERNFVTYLITNDKGIQKKAKRLGLENRVLSILSAIELFSNNDEYALELKTPVIIESKRLCDLDFSDDFFNSLKEDYDGFDEWFIKKTREHKEAYVSFLENNKLGSFLMLKIEDQNETYEQFDIPLERKKRVKISTFKVSDIGKSIGEAFIKIAIEYTILNKIDEIYVTAFDKQKKLIDLLIQYGFELYTYKQTKKQDKSIEKEGVYLKKIHSDRTNYPIIKLDSQNIFIVPIQYEYSQMLFQDSFRNYQLSIEDLEGKSTYSNAIKKVYISKSNISTIKKGDILVFYSSQVRKSIICLGVVDDAFRSQEIDTFELYEKIVKRRTVYEKDYLYQAYNNNYLTILFKHFFNLSNDISLGIAIKENILNAAPQSIQNLDREKLKKIIHLSGSEDKFKI